MCVDEKENESVSDFVLLFVVRACVRVPFISDPLVVHPPPPTHPLDQLTEATGDSLGLSLDAAGEQK